MAEDRGHMPHTALRAKAAMVLLLATIFGVQFLLAGGTYSLGRPLWFDEILTQTLVADGSVSHSLTAIADGVDFNPPTLHLLLRGYCVAYGETSESALRSFSILCAFLTLTAVLLTLCSAYRPLVALAATIGMWTADVLIAESFQARFYAAWPALIAWFCFLLTRRERDFFSAWHFALRAMLAILICTIHYFGVFSLILVVGAFYLWNRADRRRIKSLLWSVLPGPIALLACTPFFFGQRAALTVATWVPPTNLSKVLGVISMLLPMAALSVSAIALYYSQLFPGRAQRSASHARPTERLAAGVTLASLILMPIILLLFSLLVQPSMIPRYMVVACLAFGPLIVLLLDRCQNLVVLTCLLVFALTGVGRIAKLANDAGRAVREQQAILDAIRDYPHETPIVVEDGLDALPFYRYAPELRDRLAFLDFEIGEIQSPSAYAIVNRDVLRRYTKHYPGLQLISLKHLSAIDRLLVLRSEREPLAWSNYEGFRTRQVGDRLYELVRNSPQ